jgi:pimeloyl-ACP methyl ester carboxylesterase
VDDIVGVLDAFDLAAAHLVGVSPGDAMALLVALDHPDGSAVSR